MKLFLPLFTAASLATAAVAAESVPTPEKPRPVVVLVHGRGQLGLDTAMLRREWQRELDTALASVGLPALRDDEVRLAWYADVLDPEVENECAVPAGSVQELGLGEVTRVLFSSLTSTIPERESRGARALFGELLYFMDGSMRCAATRRLDAVVRPVLAQGRPVIIVAYSLGAVVAHEYLSALPVKGADIRLITAGSPLGMREFRELLFGVGAAMPPRPASVTSWVNVYDPDDAFAAPVGLDSVSDRRVERPYGGSAHFHGRYLRDPAMGRAVGEALCASVSCPAFPG